MEFVDTFAQAAKRDALPYQGPEIEKGPKHLAQAMLANLILERIEIDPDTPIEKLLEFREQYSDELGFFRTKIGELTSTIKTDEPLANLSQRVSDIYKNEYLPGFNTFKKALRGRISNSLPTLF